MARKKKHSKKPTPSPDSHRKKTQFSNKVSASLLKQKNTIFFSLMISILFILGIKIIQASTFWGIGITTDSLIYIEAARNFLAGKGITLTHYPPLYPLMLALTGIFGLDPLAGARGLHTAIFGCNILMIGFIVHKLTRGSLLATTCSALLTVSAIPMVYIHSMAWSEPLFILLGLCGLFLLTESLNSTKQSFFILSAILTGLAFFTRYAGVSLIITGFFSLLLMERKPFFKKILRAFIWGIISAGPIIIWLIRNKLVADTSTNREFVFHPVSWQQIHVGVKTVSDWFFLSETLPIQVKTGFIGILIASLAIGFFKILCVSRKEQKTASSLSSARFFCISVLFVFSYSATLLFSMSFIDAHTPFSIRILSPLYFIGGAGIICGIQHLLSSQKTGPKIATLVCLIYASFAYAQITHIKPYVEGLKKNGRGFSSRIWKQARIFNYIKELAPNTRVYTNGTDAMQIFTEIRASALPSLVNPGTRKKNQNFNAELLAMVKELSKKDGLIIYFKYITWRWYLPKNHQLKKALNLRTLYNGPDGTVYKLNR